MSEKYLRGKIIFINNNKKSATIEYVSNNKIKTIQAVIHEKQQQKIIDQKLAKKPHRFLIGDHVKFIIKKAVSGVFFADHVLYEFNNTLEVLVNKARIQNKFLGYVKKIDDQYFIKEIESYLFFPLRISRYENAPNVDDTQKVVSFKMINIEKPEKIFAELYNHSYTPGFSLAVKQFKKEEVIHAVVKKITPFAIFVELTDARLESKISMDEMIREGIKNEEIKEGTLLPVKIIHLTNDRIVVAIQ